MQGSIIASKRSSKSGARDGAIRPAWRQPRLADVWAPRDLSGTLIGYSAAEEGPRGAHMHAVQIGAGC